jgi:acetoin:2,6-dichlorophenolindophenol oxidoreductase subunit alpha
MWLQVPAPGPPTRISVEVRQVLSQESIHSWPAFDSHQSLERVNYSPANDVIAAPVPRLRTETLLKAYRTMKLIRDFEERLGKEMASGDIAGTVHLYAGQEASATGVCMHLSDGDHIVSTHRGHGHCIAKGVPIDGMMAEIFGRATGTCRGKGGSMHIADLDHGMLGANGIVGGGPPLACGAALTAKTLNTGGVAVAFFGDGAFNQGATAESLNLAMVWRLPVVFVMEDNGVGEATATSFALAGDALQRATAYGMPGMSVDGTDFFAVHEAARIALLHAREGKGPFFLHIKAPRYFGHYLGDADTYRSSEEKAAMRSSSDCLTIFRERVLEDALFEAGKLSEIDSDVSSVLDKAVAAARAAPVPDVRELTADVYVRYA